MNLKQAYDYCEEMTHRRGTNFSLGFKHLPAAKKRAIYAAYAFCRFADDISDEESVKEPEKLLAQWKQELDLCYEGRPSHLITEALSDVLRTYPVPKRVFEAMIQGCRQDLVKCRYASFEEVLDYCDMVATPIARICLVVFGHAENLSVQYWGRHFAIALQLTNILRDVGDDLDRNRIYLPAEDLQYFQCSEESLIAREVSPEFLEMMDFQCRRAWYYFRGADRLLPWFSEDARMGARLMRDIYQLVLTKVHRDPSQTLHTRCRISDSERELLAERAFGKVDELAAKA
ncbi:MAG: phytoene/squalene synthase family protein [Candidatus Omnitrophica bacterium]|nr:phytoene/squalene synthase family protein [Candidatus Omnitrophota bacterium]